MGSLDGFPTTQPAIKIKAHLTNILPCGDIHTGSNLNGVPFGEGSLKSIDGFEPKVDFKLSNGHDWFRIDADKKHGRLSIAAIATDDENRSIRVMGEGVVELNEHTMPLLFGAPGAQDIPFGFAIEHMRFECGHEPYKDLEHMLFAGSIRFVKEENGLWVDVRLARIVPGTGFE